LDASQAWGNPNERERICKALGRREVPIDLEAHHTSPATHLPFRQIVLGMTGQVRIENPSYAGMTFEETAELEPVPVVLLHTNPNRFQTPKEQVGRVGIQNSTQDAMRVLYFLHDLARAD
jgi:hypothetical protein